MFKDTQLKLMYPLKVTKSYSATYTILSIEKPEGIYNASKWKWLKPKKKKKIQIRTDNIALDFIKHH